MLAVAEHRSSFGFPWKNDENQDAAGEALFLLSNQRTEQLRFEPEHWFSPSSTGALKLEASHS